MERQANSIGMPHDLMTLNDEPVEDFGSLAQRQMEEIGPIPPPPVPSARLGIAPPSRSPSSSPSLSSSDTDGIINDEDDDDLDGDAGVEGFGGENGSGKLARDDRLWLRLATGEERRQLLGTEEESSDRHSSGGEDETGGGLEGDDEAKIWSINAEQHQYYEKQFGKLNKDPEGLLSGIEARKFFEKSGLAIPDLSAIWQLSDVTQDGKLDKGEFFTAMHLVVLRRHGIHVPETLPPTLHPARILAQGSGASTTQDDPRIKHPKAVRLTPEIVASGGYAAVDGSAAPSAPPLPQPQARESLAAESGPKSLSNHGAGGGVQVVHLHHHHQHRIRVDASEIKGIQRPTPRKTAGNKIGAVLPPPGADIVMEADLAGPSSLPPNLVGGVPPPPAPPPPAPQAPQMAKQPVAGQVPPPPPPRARTHHARSSSLDLNKLDRESPEESQQPPAVPPRSSPAPAVKPRGHTLAGPSDGRGLASLVITDSRPSAFHEYRRPGSEEGHRPEEGETGAAWRNRSLRVLNWEEERNEMKERVANLLARLPLQNSEATREEVSAAVKWLQERKQTINAEIAKLESELSFLVASRQVMEQAPPANPNSNSGFEA